MLRIGRKCVPNRKKKMREMISMINVTFKCYEPSLNRTFINSKRVVSMADFRLYAYSLYSGRWSILSVEYDVDANPLSTRT